MNPLGEPEHHGLPTLRDRCGWIYVGLSLQYTQALLDSKEVHSGFWVCFRMLHQQVCLPVRLCYSLLPHTMFFSPPCNCIRELNSLVVCLKEILGPWYGPDRFLGVTIWLHRWMFSLTGWKKESGKGKSTFFSRILRSHRNLPCSRVTVITS